MPMMTPPPSMERTTIKLCSWNSRGHGADRMVYIDDLMNRCDILVLQEHWLSDYDLHKLTQNSAHSLSVFGVSGMDPHQPRVGRPFGGCALLHKTDYRCSIEPVPVDSRRLFACIVNIPNVVKFMLFNVYMPCDAFHIHDDAVYRDVLISIESLMNVHYDVDHVIVAGDLNTDVTRIRSVHVSLLKEFCNRLSLRLCLSSAHSSVDFTYHNEASGSRSILDHFIVSENFFSSIAAYSCAHDGDNLSDHSPVFLELSVNTAYMSQISDTRAHAGSRPSWQRASADHIAAYRRRLEEFLNSVHIPTEVFNCSPYECESDDHRRMIEEYYSAIVQALVSATNSCIPKRRKKDRAGWSVHVKELQNDSVFWNRIWVASGRPRTGWVSEIRRITRAQYKRMARWVLRNQDELSAERMAEALDQNRSRDLWAEVRRVQGKSHTQSRMVDEVEGESEVCDLFKEKYESLYNSVSYDENEMKMFIQQVSAGVSRCKLNICCNHHTMYVSDVRNAVRKLKCGKSDVNPMLSSDNFIHACTDLYVHLSLLLNMMFLHSVVTKEMLLSVIVPIPKNRKKSLGDSSNYRSIAISSLIGKILDHIVLVKHAHVLQTSDLQFGFKAKQSTTQCTFIVREVVDYYVNNNSPVFVTLLDASRAFDRVHYVKLFKLLAKRNLCSSLILFLLSMYINQSLVVRWQSTTSSPFPCRNGIKQGGVLSPVLFCVYIDELICRLSQLRVGCYLGHKFTGVLTYADDITLMAPTHEATMQMLKVCEDCAREYDVLFNSSKSQVLLFSTPLTRKLNPVVKLNNEIIQYVPKAIHLGSYIGEGSCHANVTKAVNDLYVRANSLSSHFKFASYQVKLNLFNSYCSSFYGSSLWNLNCIESLCVAYRKCIRMLLGIAHRTHCRFVYKLINRPDLETQLLTRFVKFWNCSFESENEIVSLCCHTSLLPTSTSSVANNMKLLVRKLNLSQPFLSVTCQEIVSSLIELHSNSLSEIDHVTCHTIIELIRVKNNELSSPLNRNEVESILHELHYGFLAW